MKNLTTFFLVLDIETSVKNVENDSKIEPICTWLSYGVIKLYSMKFETADICKFRTWEELYDFLKYISMKFSYYKIICYCHNLSFEFDFLIKNISKPKTILTNTTHNIISSILEDFENIEFRCSYQLTGYSLRKIGSIIGMEKLDSDYRTIYPYSEITKSEWDYCERDCDIVALYITKELSNYKNIFKIPYTKTGRVRILLKENYKIYENNPEWDLLPDEECYNAMLKAFNGAITISNPFFTNKILKNVHSYDETSAYPYVGFMEYFPYTIKKQENFKNEDIYKHKFWIAKMRFNNIQQKYSWAWLSISKMEKFDDYSCEFFNGKLLHGDYIERYITNIDFETINLSYNYTDFEVLELYVCEKYSKMPRCYVETMLYCANKKYELKKQLKKDPENIDIQRDYMLSKNDFNSIGYGVHVQKLTNPNFQIDENYIWHDITTEYKKTDKHIKRNFLYGIYITAYARRNLIKGIVKNCPYTFVYADTDSIKFIGENKFENTNDKLQEPYKNIDSVKDLGKFDYECTYEKFITLGAKKYAYVINNSLHLTVAGLPKNDTQYIKDIKDFKCGQIFNNCKLGKKYLFDNISFELNENGNIVNYIKDDSILTFYKENDIISNGGVALYPTSYKLDMTKIDKQYTQFIQKNFKNVIESLSKITHQNLFEFVEE